jgi:hypothetical protein
MTASPETVAYIKQLRDYDLAADRDGTDSSNPPQPPNANVAWEAAAATAKLIALLIGYNENRVLPTDMEPTPLSQLAAAELIEQYTNRTTKEGNR